MTTTKPRVHIQWKGTDACLDFYCPCGLNGHVDGTFLYFLKCGRCGQEYQVATLIDMEPITEPSGQATEVRDDIPF